MENSSRAVQNVLAKRTLREYAPQIINGKADTIGRSIAPHPGKGRTAGLLRRLPGMDADAVAAERQARQGTGAMVSVRILRRFQSDAEVFAAERGDAESRL